MSKWKTVNLEVRHYEQLKKLADAENKSLGSKLGEAVDAYIGTDDKKQVDMVKLAGSVKWTNYRVAMIFNWLEQTMPKEVVERVRDEIDSKRNQS
jgi:hypothetical protein